jgi:hypothetical protein
MRPCATPNCPHSTTPSRGYKQFIFCKDCGAARKLARARENMRKRRATPQDRYRIHRPETVTVPAAGSWWMARERAGFTAVAESRAAAMSASKGAGVVSQLEMARDAVGR